MILRLLLRRSLHAGLLAVLLVLFAGCELSGETDRSVGGVDVDELFAPPSASEIAAIRAEWDDRAIVVEDFDVLGEDAVELENGDFNVSLVSHAVDGVRHRGAFIVPDDAEGSLAVLVYAHGGDDGVAIDTEVYAFVEHLGDLAREVVIVVPSYRSETLRFKGTSFTSEGEPSPWDWDVDDSLSLMQAALDHVPGADENRIGAVGLSRGALVAKLMAARDARIEAVVSYFGPTDFYSEWVQAITEDALRGSMTPLPGVRYLAETFVLPLQDGDLTIDDVRHEITRRSIVLFVEDLPAVQLHHGDDDFVVPVSQATHFRVAMEGAGRTPSDEGDFQYFTYPADPPYDRPIGQHHPDELSGAFERSVSFLNTYVLTGETMQ